jgi:voltage-gated potassium channel
MPSGHGGDVPTPAARSRRTRLARDLAMVALAIVSIALLAVEEWFAPGSEEATRLLYLDLAIVGVFWVEYLHRLRKAPENPERYPTRWEFVKANWYDLPGMIPILPGMEAIASVRVLRLLRVLRILRLLGALRQFDRFDRAVQRFIYQSKLGFVAVFALALVLVCATLAWLVEPGTFRDDWWNAVWWGIVTVTTVGYGDFFPVTGTGRIVAMVLMFLGVALIGTFAATLSSFLVERRFQGPGPESAGAPVAPSGDSPLPGFAIAAELERLDRLHQRGALTAEEFARAKDRLLR